MKELFELAEIITAGGEDEGPLIIQNDGGKLIFTNYFESQASKSGGVYLTWNAGECRMLIPSSKEEMILSEISSAYAVDLEVKGDQIYMWFDDGQPQQYCVAISVHMSDRVIDESGPRKLRIYTQSLKEIMVLDMQVLPLPRKYDKV